MHKILLIGCGHMGGALLKSWSQSNKYKITVVDKLNFNILKKKYKKEKINFFNSISKLKKSSKFDLIVLAVRPAELESVLDKLSPSNLRKQTAIISVVAGKKILNIQKKFKNIKNFFRVMPNMPASIGQSMNCIVSNKRADKKIKMDVMNLFSYSGKSLFLGNEKQIDMATAISGSGPGFVFYLIDAMEKAAEKLGFKNKISKILISETFKGSINLMIQTNVDAEKLVKAVATKGGTTEAGLKIMKNNNVHKLLQEVTKASYKRAKEQGK